MKTVAAFFAGALVVSALVMLKTGGLETCAKNEPPGAKLEYLCSIKPLPPNE